MPVAGALALGSLALGGLAGIATVDLLPRLPSVVGAAQGVVAIGSRRAVIAILQLATIGVGGAVLQLRAVDIGGPFLRASAIAK